jgi:hypothetical protein
MSISQSRREFMVHSSQAGAALALLGGASGAFAAAASSAEAASVNPDLLHALGNRIGLEVAEQIGEKGAPLLMNFLDCAGPSVDALRDGIEQGLHWHSGAAPACIEVPSAHGAVIGVALIRNPVSGRTARVEIDATALGMIALIESVKTPASSHKHAVLTASADNLYRVQYLS